MSSLHVSVDIAMYDKPVAGGICWIEFLTLHVTLLLPLAKSSFP